MDRLAVPSTEVLGSAFANFLDILSASRQNWFWEFDG